MYYFSHHNKDLQKDVLSPFLISSFCVSVFPSVSPAFVPLFSLFSLSRGCLNSCLYLYLLPHPLPWTLGLSCNLRTLQSIGKSIPCTKSSKNWFWRVGEVDFSFFLFQCISVRHRAPWEDKSLPWKWRHLSRVGKEWQSWGPQSQGPHLISEAGIQR